MLSGSVECSLAASAPADTGFFSISPDTRPNSPALAGDAGEPFASKEPYVFSPPAGAPLGEWLLLQPSMAQMPRVVAHTVCQCLVLPEDTLTAAMQQDEQLTANLWWARCQRETFCLLRKLEPFCWWQASKLWQWVAFGRHIKVPEGRGQLGAQAPFVVLVHGKCHISYQEHMNDNGDSAGARYSIDGQRRRLGSMKLLGSGAKIADLLTFHTKNAKPTGKESPLTTPHGTPTNGGGGKWVPGPDVVHCHEEISYHFSRDSLVFIPSERGLPWLPTNYLFSTPRNGAEGSPQSPFGIRAAERAGSPPALAGLDA